MTNNELRELCMEVRELSIEDGMEQEEKEKVLIALEAFLETQGAGFSEMCIRDSLITRQLQSYHIPANIQ